MRPVTTRMRTVQPAVRFPADDQRSPLVTLSAQQEAVRAFYASFDAQRLDAFVESLHPHVELQTARGLRIGLAEARAWATKNPAGDLDQRFVIEELREQGNHVVALVRQQWWWAETEELAEDKERAALFTFRDGLIARWQPFTDRSEALRAAGIE